MKHVMVSTTTVNEELLYANDETVLELPGANTLSLAGNYLAPAGIAVEGDKTITDGTGSLYADVRND